MTKKFGIIGYPLSHSFSPAFFNRKFAEENIDAVYDAYPIAEISLFPALLKSYPDFAGLNVTIPYKTTILPYLDVVDEVAAEIGAVNCICFSKGKTKGFNTDVTGFAQSLYPLLLPHHTQALVLGNGGAAKAVTHVLRALGITFKVVSRSPAADMLSYADITPQLLQMFTVVINTTPAGMFPNIAAVPPLPFEAVTEEHLFFDLIYNPAETQLLQQARMRGATTKNGLEMLELQAMAGWLFWNS